MYIPTRFFYSKQTQNKNIEQIHKTKASQLNQIKNGQKYYSQNN